MFQYPVHFLDFQIMANKLLFVGGPAHGEFRMVPQGYLSWLIPVAAPMEPKSPPLFASCSFKIQSTLYLKKEVHVGGGHRSMFFFVHDSVPPEAEVQMFLDTLIELGVCHDPAFSWLFGGGHP